ncbi:MAG: methyltransferase [Betaproteobacteria bacterium]
MNCGYRHAQTLLASLPILVAIAAGCSTTPVPAPAAAISYASVIASPLRTDQDRRMDASRRPGSFLPFTQARPGMRILDVSAGGGYTSQLLAIAVGPTGRVWAQAQKPGPTLQKRLADQPQANLIVVERPFEDPVPEQASNLDLVTIVLNYHDISYLPVDRDKMNARLFAALKPGGHLVITDHAGRSGTGISEGKMLHRIEKDFVVAEVRRAGFVLEAEDDFLRNPADPRDQSSNDTKISSDKFALRFAKPK